MVSTAYLRKLKRTISWMIDKSEGCMIEKKGYRKTHLGFEDTSQEELDELCSDMEHVVGSPLLTNSMGEIIAHSALSTLIYTKD